MPKYNDSVGKIKGYLESASMEEVAVSKLFFREYNCPSHCGGCCPRFSLDYFEGSERWEKFKKEYPEQVHRFKRREVEGVVLYSDLQDDHENWHCRNLDMSNGRCKIHKVNPFSCEFELNKFITYKKPKKSTLINKLFGRGWNLLRIDGERGALCSMGGYNHEKFLRDVKLLEELKWISEKFGIKTRLDKIVEFFRSNEEKIKENQGIKEDKIVFKKVENED